MLATEQNNITVEMLNHALFGYTSLLENQADTETLPNHWYIGTGFTEKELIEHYLQRDQASVNYWRKTPLRNLIKKLCMIYFIN